MSKMWSIIESARSILSDLWFKNKKNAKCLETTMDVYFMNHYDAVYKGF